MPAARHFLIDTHCWLWWHINPEKLSSRVFRLIENGDSDISFSVVSAWEIVIKHNLQKLELPFPPLKYIPKKLEMSYMDVLPVQLSHALQVQKLPDYHKDPFDRLLIAQAISEKFVLITDDSQIGRYEVDLIW
ncbi:type II toxin-antitoxin system VapC family toxin [bacterium]|nr:type II toxin-antitoxin system VapC family toxin [bacterium]